MYFTIEKNIPYPKKPIKEDKFPCLLDIAERMKHNASILIEANRIISVGENPFGVAMRTIKALHKKNKKGKLKKFKNGDYRIWCVGKSIEDVRLDEETIESLKKEMLG